MTSCTVSGDLRIRETQSRAGLHSALSVDGFASMMGSMTSSAGRRRDGRMAKRDTAGVFFHPPATDGDAAQLIRARDWSTSALGPAERWPRSLHNYLRMILELPTAA